MIMKLNTWVSRQEKKIDTFFFDSMSNDWINVKVTSQFMPVDVVIMMVFVFFSVYLKQNK